MNESTTNMRTEEAIKEKIKESRFESINGKDLMEMDLPPLHYTISTILPHGFFILAGGAKVGKSWLAEQISYAVASGGQIWGYQAIQSEVLYLGLEDTFRTQFKQVVSLCKAAHKFIAVCTLLIGSQDNFLFAHIDRAKNSVFTDFSFSLVHIHTSAYFNHNSDVSAVAATALP